MFGGESFLRNDGDGGGSRTESRSPFLRFPSPSHDWQQSYQLFFFFRRCSSFFPGVDPGGRRGMMLGEGRSQNKVALSKKSWWPRTDYAARSPPLPTPAADQQGGVARLV